MTNLIVVLLLVATNIDSQLWADQSNGLWPLPNGLYVERDVDGMASCNTVGRRHFRLNTGHVVQSDEYGASSFNGSIELNLEDHLGTRRLELSSIMVVGMQDRAQMDRRLGVIRGASLMEGGLDSVTSGEFSGLLWVHPNGDVDLANFSEMRAGDFSVLIETRLEGVVQYGALANGLLLQAFAKCDLPEDKEQGPPTRP
jgi:hypothetical protein